MLTIRSISTHPLAFAGGDPVRAASAITRLHDHWLIAQDDATHAAVWRPADGPAEPLRVFQPVQGEDTFSEAAGTKDLKPDLEAACTVRGEAAEMALMLGSGSKTARMRGALIAGPPGAWTVRTANLEALYHRVADALGIALEVLNLEGACVVGEQLRWFQRGHGSGVASAAVDLDLATLLSVIRSRAAADSIDVQPGATFELGDVDGVPLAITDAANLPDGRIVVSAAAEDAPNNVDDGPIVGSAIAVIDDGNVTDVTPLPLSDDGEVWKVEGIAVREANGTTVELMAVVDQDDPGEPSLALALQVQLG